MFKMCLSLLSVAVLGILAGCSTMPSNSADVTAGIRTNLDQAGLKNVSVSQDRDKGVITLNGNVPAEFDKAKAASIAQSVAGSLVVANQIAVLPPGVENEAKKIGSDLDSGIASNLDAALINDRLHKRVKYDVKNGVVTLTGEVGSQADRARAEDL